MGQKHIRNFSIIAHIDHGKSTIADRLIEYTGTLSEREMEAQVLDSMDLERERGITIKAQTVRLDYRGEDGELYELNLIDTPGHVDFNYEVSRSLAACEGALLVVDAAQGVEAQTLANVYLALEHDLEIVPVINKIDLPSAEPERVKEEIEDSIGLDTSAAVLASAKTGIGIKEILDAVVAYIPPPEGDADAPLRALIFDSYFDAYKGVIAHVRIKEGVIKKGMKLKLMATGKTFEVTDVGCFRPRPVDTGELRTGEVGFIAGALKDVRDVRVGDTVTSAKAPAAEPLAGYQDPKPMVFSGLFPVDGSDFPALRDALDKLKLNDAALTYEPETSVALGFGFRCGYLGLLHLEIIRERLEREFNLDIISTAPSVVYEVTMEDRSTHTVTNPSEFPEGKVSSVSEPVVRATILTPSEFVGTVMELCQSRRGTMQGMDYLSESRVEMHYVLPLAEIVFDFFDALKSRTRGYASLDYEADGSQDANLVKVDSLLNGDKVDAFSAIVHRDSAYSYGVMMTKRLKDLIPRQQFEVPVQAAIGTRVIARETIRALRKDMLAKCYGGDITRKRKLLEKQKEGKKRMKAIGRVEVPQEAFIAALGADTPTGAKPGK